MTWADDPGDPGSQHRGWLGAAERWVGQVARLTRALFEREHAIVADELEHVHDPGTIPRVVEFAQGRVEDAKLRYYRRVYAEIGQHRIAAGVPPGLRDEVLPDREERQEEFLPGVEGAWGPAGSSWWTSEFLPAAADNPVVSRWLTFTLSYARRTGSKKIRAIDRSTRSRVRDEIQAGLERGEGISDIRGRIDGLYLDQIIPNRSEVIARTEALTAARAGSYNATLALGDDVADNVTKSWLATLDGRERDTHADAHFSQDSVPFKEPFRVANPQTGVVERLQFPGDTSLGAGVANVAQCRCDSTKNYRPPPIA